MEPPKASVDPIQHPSVPSRNEFIQNGFSDFAATGASKVSPARLNDGHPTWCLGERSMPVLNVEYITPARPIWMSHNRCFHVFRSITDLSGRSSSRGGLCRCQQSCRRLWCRLTICPIGPQCPSQKRHLNSTQQTAWGKRMRILWFVIFVALVFITCRPGVVFRTRFSLILTK